jgi:hypothetical protein
MSHSLYTYFIFILLVGVVGGGGVGVRDFNHEQNSIFKFTSNARPALLYDNLAKKLHFHIYRIHVHNSTVTGNISCKKSPD